MSRDVEAGVMRLFDVDVDSDTESELVPLGLRWCSPIDRPATAAFDMVLGLSRAVPVDVVQLSGYQPRKLIPPRAELGTAVIDRESFAYPRPFALSGSNKTGRYSRFA